MRKLRIQLAFTAALASAPVGAADWDSVAGWDIYEIDRTRCVVGRTFPEAGGTIVGIILGIDGEVRLFANSTSWNMHHGGRVDAAVRLDDRIAIDDGFVGVAEQSRRGFVAAAPPAFLAGFASANRLTVEAGKAAHSLPLSGSAAGLAQGQQCVANLREEARDLPAQPRFVTTKMSPVRPHPATATFRSSAPAAISSRAVPLRSKSSWVAADDYPDAALRGEQEGQVTVKLAIDRSGEVADCDVIRSSGSQTLDGTTCRIIQRRARYRPATDTVGRPVASFDQHTVRWSLPD